MAITKICGQQDGNFIPAAPAMPLASSPFNDLMPSKLNKSYSYDGMSTCKAVQDVCKCTEGFQR